MASLSNHYQKLKETKDDILEAGIAVLERSSANLNKRLTSLSVTISNCNITDKANARAAGKTSSSTLIVKPNAASAETVNGDIVEDSKTTFPEPSQGELLEPNLNMISAACKWENLLHFTLSRKRGKTIKVYKYNGRRNAICEEDLLERKALLLLLTDFARYKQMRNYNLF